MPRRRHIRLSDAQASALECSGAVACPEGREERLLRAAFDQSNRRLLLPRTKRGLRALASALVDAANAEDAHAEHDNDPETRAFARQACRSLTAIHRRILRAEMAR